MTDLLQSAVSWLGVERTTNMATAVTYRRGVTTASVLATQGQTTYEVDDGGGFIVEAQATDFIVSASELTEFGDPELADQIETADAVFEVLAIGRLGHWRWSGPHHVSLRIHTKQVGVPE